MSLLWIVAICVCFEVIVAGAVAGVGAMVGQRCYVCVGESAVEVVQELFPDSVLVSCRHAAEPKECPDNYRGCLTQIKGREVTRTCVQFAGDSCRLANGVEYCYCTGPLCNAPPPPPQTSDDEDLADAEGSGQLTTVTVTDATPSGTRANHTATDTAAPSSFAGQALSVVTALVLLQIT